MSFLVLLKGLCKVSYEYIACQQKRNGAMILSEFAGAAQSLNGSIIVNPWDSQQLADAIHEAVTMDAETRKENQRKLFKVSLVISSSIPLQCGVSPFLQYVNKYSAAYWGTSFVREIGRLNASVDVEKAVDDLTSRHKIPNGNGHADPLAPLPMNGTEKGQQGLKRDLGLRVIHGQMGSVDYT
jgi:trehalose 6-phosphate synthase